MKKILVTGATGKLGSLVVEELVGKMNPENIFVLVRDLQKAGTLKEKGVNLIKGDYDDYSSLVSAFEGVDKLFFISGSDVLNRNPQHENIVKAAKTVQVGHIIYTSFQRKTDDSTSPIALVASGHILAEKLIKASGLRFTILKHALYSDFVNSVLGGQVLKTGIISLPAANGKTSFTSRDDMASAGVAVLTGKGHENMIYEISAGKSYSFSDIAGILSNLSGKTIRYEATDIESFSLNMSRAGLPKEAIQVIGSFCLAIAQGEFDFPDNTLEKLIGRKPESLKDFLKKAYKL